MDPATVQNCLNRIEQFLGTVRFYIKTSYSRFFLIFFHLIRFLNFFSFFSSISFLAGVNCFSFSSIEFVYLNGLFKVLLTRCEQKTEVLDRKLTLNLF